MSVNMENFQRFAEAVHELGREAPPCDLTDAECLAQVKDTFARKLTPSMAMQLEACVHCGQCAEACQFYVETGDPKYTPIRKLDLLKRFYRRELSPMRWLHRLYTRDITLNDLQEWQELVYDSCTECARCSMVCPMGINIAEMVLINRQALAKANLIPSELRAMAFEQCENASLFGVGPEQFKQMVEGLEAQGLEVHLDEEQADILLLTSVVDIMLFNDVLAASVKLLNRLGKSWTFSSKGYEAANFGFLSGVERVQKIASERVIEAAKACGAKMVIVPECGHAYPSLRWEAANIAGEPLPFEVLAISEFLGRELKVGNLKLNRIGHQKKVTFHDPCKISRHSGADKDPRDLLRALDVDFREAESAGIMNWCCGGGAGVFLLERAAGLRQAAFRRKIKQFDATGADSVVLTCGSCRLNFMVGAQKANWDKGIESLVELVAANVAEGRSMTTDQSGKHHE